MTDPLVPAPPFLPFARPVIDEDTITEVARVLRSGWLTGGPQVRAFEAALSRYCGGRVVRTFSSGTAALAMALRLLNLAPGDQVITTPLTWVATANVIIEAGAELVLVDIEASTRMLDLDAVEAAITPRTRAIMPVDLAGLPLDRDRLYRIAQKHGLRVIEDAAQSFGAQWNGRPIGACGDFVAFSFQANKNLTTGEGGALVLPPDADVGLCERLRLQGVTRLDDGSLDADVIGTKANLGDIAATLGLGQLARLAESSRLRRELAQGYFALLGANAALAELALPPQDPPGSDAGRGAQSNWHMFQVLLPQDCPRGRFIQAMKAEGIGIGVHYPALHLFSVYRQRGYGPGDFPVAEDVGRRIATLPLHAMMTLADVQRVCSAAERALMQARSA